LKRAELPIDTASLARFLIGKTFVRDAPEGRTSGRIVGKSRPTCPVTPAAMPLASVVINSARAEAGLGSIMVSDSA
jgi:hypothetical protein